MWHPTRTKVVGYVSRAFNCLRIALCRKKERTQNGISQRYVSNELSHFVGRGKSEDEQYRILVERILKPGWLTHPPHHDPTKPRTLSLDLSKPISTDEMFKYQVVCFCDIPESDLAIHTRKYSRFGLAFEKNFLIDRGACPVFYVANESPVPINELFSPGDFVERIEQAQEKGLVDRALYFDTTVRAIVDLFACLDMAFNAEETRYIALPDQDFKARMKSLLGLTDAEIAKLQNLARENTQISKTTRKMLYFILNDVFSFVKCFDAKQNFEEESNFYMEREWRVGNNVHFSLDDVSRVFLPKGFAKRFRADLPSYAGQISFSD